MGYAPGSGNRIIVDTDHVHQVGAQIKQDAAKLLGSEPEGVQDFQKTMTQLNDNNFPPQLYSTFYQFINIHTTAFTQIFQDRQSIGDARQDVKNATEESEIQKVASFTPTPGTDLNGPQEYTIVK